MHRGKFFKASSMIATEYFDSSPQRLDGAVGHIVLRPNNSMTWRAAQYFLGVLMAISFTRGHRFSMARLLDDTTVYCS